MCEIRLLEPSDIEVRAQQVKENGAVLLLYKNARVDMSILDEKFGMFGWQREHLFKDGKNYCRVSIWDGENKQWVTKEDIGTESNTEREKGEASDAFKRACVNIGIGRELYTAPFIWVNLQKDEVFKNEKSNNWQIKSGIEFSVSEIEYDNKRSISKLVIIDRNGTERYRWPNSRSTPRTSAESRNPIEKAEPVKPSTKKRLTAEIFDNHELLDKLLNWMYGFLTTEGYPKDFDPGAHLLKFYEADGEVLDRFSQLFESYRQARNNSR